MRFVGRPRKLNSGQGGAGNDGVADFLHGFLFPHAMAFYANVLGLSNDHDRLSNVADYILAHKLEKITVRDVARGDRSMRGLRPIRCAGWSIRPYTGSSRNGRTRRENAASRIASWSRKS